MSYGPKRIKKQIPDTRRMALVMMGVVGVVILLLLAGIYRQRSASDFYGSHDALIRIGDDDINYISEHASKNGRKDNGGKTSGNAEGKGGSAADGNSENGRAGSTNGRNGSVNDADDSGNGTNSGVPDRYELDVNCIPQLPELPGGCEPVTLTMVLNYLGIQVDKYLITDQYLPKGAIGETDPSEAFVGDPYDAYGAYGCYAPVIVNAANRFFKDNEYGYVAVDISETDMNELIEQYVYKYRRPAIVWASKNMEEMYPTAVWFVNGREIIWRHNNHCMALSGWDEENYIVADPLSGVCRYGKALFENRYIQNHMNAVFIMTAEEYAQYAASEP